MVAVAMGVTFGFVGVTFGFIEMTFGFAPFASGSVEMILMPWGSPSDGR